MATGIMFVHRAALCLVLSGACGGDDAEVAPGDVVGAYLAVGQSLAKDEVEPLSKLSAQVSAAAQIKKGESGIDTLAKGASTLDAGDLPAARTAFKAMSAGMIEYLQAHPDEQAGHTIVHCPMAFGGKGGLWVQKEGKVQNPYEGLRMPSCGDKLGWTAELPKT